MKTFQKNTKIEQVRISVQPAIIHHLASKLMNTKPALFYLYPTHFGGITLQLIPGIILSVNNLIWDKGEFLNV